MTQASSSADHGYRFQGKFVLTGELECVTGLRIGGSTEGFEIGGLDNPVIRDPVSEEPYIPGSSLKGKLRHLLEWKLGKIERHPKHGIYTAHSCGDCPACWIFGVASDNEDVRKRSGPSRLTVRDARLTEDSRKSLCEPTGGLFTEIKSENALDRITSSAMPRPMERVPPGACFGIEMIFDVYRDDDRRLLHDLLTAMRLLEDSALGSSGSRGYGKVRFKNLRLVWRPLAYYSQYPPPAGAEEVWAEGVAGPEELQQKIGERVEQRAGQAAG
jgi:CRISPR-associated protein Csm3